MKASIVSIGTLSVELFADGQQPRLTIEEVSLTLTPLTGRKLFDALTVIRGALVAARGNLKDHGSRECELVELLDALEIPE